MRHYCYSVSNIAKFNKKVLISCPFYKRNAAHIFVRTASKAANSEVVTLMREYRKELKNCLEEILGLKLSEQHFFKFDGDFIDAKGFYFSGISKRNLPYYFLFLLPNEHVYKCFIMDKDICEVIHKKVLILGCQATIVYVKP